MATPSQTGTTTVDRNKIAQQEAAKLGWTKGFGASVEKEFNDWKKTNGAKLKANTETAYQAALSAANPNQSLSLLQHMANQVGNPVLPTNTQLTPVAQTVQQNELLQGPGNIAVQNIAPGAAITAPTVAAPNTVTPQTIAQAAQVQPTAIDATTGATTSIDIGGVMYNLNPNTGQYVPVTIGDQTPQMEAAQGTVDPMSTIKGQLASLYADMETGELPAWAQGAMAKANDTMAARGLGASSIAGGAITAAIQQSALQIAAQDASTYFQMDLTNLSNEQQARLENVRNRQQAMLTDVGIQNAALQFNATNQLQVEQFTAQMVANIAAQNASMANAMEQFNVAQVNSIAAQNSAQQLQSDQFNVQTKTAIDSQNAAADLQSQQFNVQAKLTADTTNAAAKMEADKYNTEMDLAVKQFNAQANYQRDVFNANMAAAIEQANVSWRKQINTQTTADINAANQVNTQNRFNLSATAQNNLWQAFRDEASWAWQSSENAANRAFNAAQAANAQQFQSDQGLGQAIGTIGNIVLGSWLGGTS